LKGGLPPYHTPGVASPDSKPNKRYMVQSHVVKL
jgi:hypothetical protein